MTSEPVEMIERILGDCFRSLAVLPNARVLEDRVTGVITGVPMTFFNGAALAAPDCDVASVIATFRGHPFRWWTSPSSDIGDILVGHGLRHVWSSAGMHTSLASPASVQSPAKIRMVTHDAELHTYAHVLMEGFDRPRSAGDTWFETYRQLGPEWTHFLATVANVPVATSSLLMSGGLAGIYHVVTLPQYRGRGIGAAVTLAAMQHARELGAKDAVLQASEMGASVYRGIGFEAHCMLHMYEG